MLPTHKPSRFGAVRSIKEAAGNGNSFDALMDEDSEDEGDSDDDIEIDIKTEGDGALPKSSGSVRKGPRSTNNVSKTNSHHGYITNGRWTVDRGWMDT